MCFKCVKCGFYPLVFEGQNEYEPHPVTGEKYCFSCAITEFSNYILEDSETCRHSITHKNSHNFFKS